MIRIRIFEFASYALLALQTLASQRRNPEELADIYRKYDVPHDEAPTCPDSSEISTIDNLCPSDNGATSIGRIETITKFCENNLSTDIVAASRTIEPNTGQNAVEGCKKFVACYIVRYVTALRFVNHFFHQDTLNDCNIYANDGEF